MNDVEYWVNKEPEELGKELRSRIQKCITSWSSTADTWSRLERAYYGEDFSGSGTDAKSITAVGRQGELLGFRANHFRAVLQIQNNMVTNTVLVLKAKAQSGDDQSKRDAQLASEILPGYEEEHKIPLIRNDMDRVAGIYGSSYVHLKWEVASGAPGAMGDDQESAGDDIDPETAEDGRALELMERISKGNVSAKVLEPYKVYFDHTWDGHGDMPWVAIEDMENRYDLWAKYGEPLDDNDEVKLELQRVIFGASSEPLYRMWGNLGQHEMGGEDGDFVPVVTFYHPVSPRCPTGKVFQMVGDMLLTPDHDWREKRVPVVRMCPEVRPGNPFGHGNSWHLLALQEQYDAITSAALTALDKGSKSYWKVPPGANISMKKLDKGGVFRSEEAPELIQFKPDLSHYLQSLAQCRRDIDEVSGVNAVTRGDAENGIFDNARAMNVAASQAFNRLSQRHDAFKRACTEVSTVVLLLLRANVGLERTIKMTGMDGAEIERTWSGDNLEGLDVTFEVVNPAMNHAAGRQDTLDYLYEHGRPFVASEYEEVMTTGRMDVITRPLREEQRVIAAENKLLEQGQHVPVLPGDNHAAHLTGHGGKFNDMDARMFLQQRTQEFEQVLAAHEQQMAEYEATVGSMPPDAIVPPPPEAPVMELSPAEQHMADHVASIRETPNELLAVVDPRLLDIKRMALEVESMEMQLAPPPPPPMDVPPGEGPLPEAPMDEEMIQ